MHIPVLTIDGPSASGKGTVASQVAKRLGFHHLDSGALYRLLALYSQQHAVATHDESELARLATQLPASFEQGEAFLNGEAVESLIRTEEMGARASEIAALPQVRIALVDRQRQFRSLPGLVAEGRDMGAVIFPDALVKIFLTASAQARAERRFKQLNIKGDSGRLDALLKDILARDQRDSARACAPLQKEADALLLDTTNLSVGDAVEAVIQAWQTANS